MDLDLPPPILVEDARGMERLLQDLERQSEIAVDTEADSFFNFREKVCLVQITAEDRDYLVDPLTGLDISPLGRILADPARTKVFHDGEYDILILKRDHGFEFGCLFDTRVAAAALGEESPGLASVLRAHFGIELDKSLQRSNWSHRPLSREQVRYARLDTRFLIPLMHQQKDELERRGRMMIVEGECRRLERLVPVEPSFDPGEFIHLKGARKLDAHSQQCLRELFVLRHRLAGEANLPPFKVLNNQALLELANAKPRSLRELASMHAISPRQARRLGEQVVAACERARRLGPLQRLPAPIRRETEEALSDEELELHERLKRWRKDRAQREGFDASLVLNRHVLLRLAKRKPRTLEELKAVDGLLDWQLERFGEDIVQLVRSSLEEIAAGGLPRTRRGTRRGRG